MDAIDFWSWVNWLSCWAAINIDGLRVKVYHFIHIACNFIHTFSLSCKSCYQIWLLFKLCFFCLLDIINFLRVIAIYRIKNYRFWAFSPIWILIYAADPPDKVILEFFLHLINLTTFRLNYLKLCLFNNFILCIKTH